MAMAMAKHSITCNQFIIQTEHHHPMGTGLLVLIEMRWFAVFIVSLMRRCERSNAVVHALFLDWWTPFQFLHSSINCTNLLNLENSDAIETLMSFLSAGQSGKKEEKKTRTKKTNAWTEHLVYPNHFWCGSYQYWDGIWSVESMALTHVKVINMRSINKQQQTYFLIDARRSGHFPFYCIFWSIWNAAHVLTIYSLF